MTETAPPAPTSGTPAGGWPVRGWRDGDDARLRRIDDLAFGFTVTDAHWAVESAPFEHDRTIFITDPARRTDPADPDAIVGSAGAYSWEISVPGGRTVRAAAVTWVSVSPTHRRRGLLRALMAAQLADVARRGEPVAMLWCSEATIYGRFGYGHATSHVAHTVDRHRAGIDPALVAAGNPLQAEMADPLASLAEVESVYESMRRTRPGMPRRDDRWQRAAVADHDAERDGASTLRVVLFRDPAGTVRAAARFRVEGFAAETVGNPRRTRVVEQYADSPAAGAAAWAWLGQLDLVGGYRASTRPVDDPLPLQLTDLRAARTETQDAIWVRLVDLPGALAARGYAGAADVVLDVSDAALPANAGRWRVRTAGPGAAGAPGAEVTRTDDPADVALDTSVLATAYLGRAGALLHAQQAGRLTEHRPGAVAELSRALDSELAPWCPVHF